MRVEQPRRARFLAVAFGLTLAACGDAASQDTASTPDMPASVDESVTATLPTATSPIGDATIAGDDAEVNADGASDRCSQVLASGCSGGEVSRLQQLLVDKGIAALAVDGEFGPLTEEALETFEAGCESCVRDGQIRIDGDEWRVLDELPDASATTDGAGGSAGADGDGQAAAGDACFDCGDVPPSGVEAFLTRFTGGASAFSCDLLGETGEVDDGELFAGPRDDTVRLGTHVFFCVVGFRPGEAVEVTIARPDGSSRSLTVLPTGGDVLNAVMYLDGTQQTEVVRAFDSGGPANLLNDILWVVEPDLAVGQYEVSATQSWDDSDGNGEPVTLVQSSPPVTFDVVAASEPRVEISLPQRRFGEPWFYDLYAPGDTLRFFFSGFPPGDTVRPLLYRHDPDDASCGFWCFGTELDALVVDEFGVAELRVATTSAAPAGLYCLTSFRAPDCSSTRGFDAEFFLGEPFNY